MARRGDRSELRERGRADPALGHADGADERRIVVVVGDQPQVGDQVLDLGAVEPRLAAGHEIGNVLRPQFLLEQLRLVVAAVEDRVVRPAGAVVELVREQPPHHAFGLGLVVGRRRHPQRVAGPVLAPQLLVEELRIVGDQRVGRAQDPHRRPVVLLELDHLERRVVERQLREVLDRRAAPAVDRLVVVADRGQPRALAGQQPQQPVLRRVGVLVLVDEQLAAALAPARRRGLRRARAARSAARSGRRSRPPGTRAACRRSARRRRRRRLRRRLAAAFAAAAGATSAFFHWLIFHCALRARARSVVAISSATIGSMSSGSRIEKPGLSPSAFESPRTIDSPSAWKVLIRSACAASRRPAPASSAPTRSRISRAALLVKVIAAIVSGACPSSSRCAIFAVITRVLPLPAPASTSSGPST